MIRPYILCNNNAEEVINFYADIFEATKQIQYYKDLPPGHDPIPEEFKMKVLHGSIKFKDNEIMFCDNPFPEDDKFKPSGFVSISLTFDTQEDLKQKYDKLTQGGKTYHALGSTFFANSYAWFVDKFGLSWQFMQGSLV